MNWYIGQEIVCVRSGTRLKKGLLYKIKSLRQCACGVVLIDVGITIHDYVGLGLFMSICSKCKAVISKGTDNTSWFSEVLFAPLADISELKEMLEKQPEKEKV